jgi:N-sulfoglucosamine sulfohydrolase
VGLLLREVEAAGAKDSTLTIFFSDNGIPFPSGKTNLGFEQGQAEPLLISSPLQKHRGLLRSSAVVSSLDLLPTILDWAGVEYPRSATAAGKPVTLSGASLLTLLDTTPKDWRATAYGSHQFHSLYAYYPMRSLRTPTHRLVHNLNYDLTFPILEDVFNTPTWTAIESAGEAGTSTGWVYDYKAYKNRPEWQLFDIRSDPLCRYNLAGNASAATTLATMQAQLREWRLETNDPWVACTTGAVPGKSWADEHVEICSF